MPQITVVCISIGPVQEFIAAARRTRDFAFGSHVLAVLARNSTKLILPHASPVIFPADVDSNAANKIVYIHQSQSSIADVMLMVETELRALLVTEVDRVLAGKNLPSESLTRAKAQVSDILEFYWAYAQHETYAEAYAEAEAILAARKSFRDFEAFPMGAQLPKSSITGTYESIIPEELHSPTHAKRLFRDFRARTAERLSGVDVLKRLGALGFSESFPSIAVMAARSALIRSSLFDRDTQTVSPSLNEAWKSIDAEIRFHSSGESFPGRSFEHSPYQECLFEGRLADEIVDETALKQMTISHQQFVRQFNIQLDKPYYAILQADGDRMGAIIQACLGASQNEQAHIALSFALSRFSNTVKDIVAQHAGVTVYSGGDDLLALLPVQTAIACATAVQQAFVAAIQPMLHTYHLELQPSVSVGLVIAHHMDPMSDVLQQVRRTEQTAKIKRSSLALTVSKRSGGNVTITGEWSSGIVARLNALVECFRNGQLPHGYAYELRAMVSKLYAENTDDATTASILKLESERILKRKNTADGKAAPIQQMMMMYQSIAANSERERSTEWINELIVAREIA